MGGWQQGVYPVGHRANDTQGEKDVLENQMVLLFCSFIRIFSSSAILNVAYNRTISRKVI